MLLLYICINNITITLIALLLVIVVVVDSSSSINNSINSSTTVTIINIFIQLSPNRIAVVQIHTRVSW